MEQSSVTFSVLREDQKNAMRAQDSVRKGVLSAVIAGAILRGKDARDLQTKQPAPRAPNEEDTIAAIRTYIKETAETADGYRQANRFEEAASKDTLVEIAKAYLPKALSADQLADVVDQIVSTLPQVSMKQMGDVMKVLTERFGLSLNKAEASPVVKARLMRG